MLARRANGSQTLGKVQSGLIVGPFWAGKKHSQHLAKESEMSCCQPKRTMLWLGGHRVHAVVVGMWSAMLVCVHCDSTFVCVCFHKSSEPDEIDVLKSATVGNNAQRQALIPIMQQTPRLLARTHSSPSPRRLRLERCTATN